MVGVWENKAHGTTDCQTGLPAPNAQIIRGFYTFNLGGTMSADDIVPQGGLYRTAWHGIWIHTSGRNYTAGYVPYSYNPDRTFAVVKLRTNIRLGKNFNSFSEKGTFEVLDPNDRVLFSGCFADRSNRLRF